MLFVIIVVIIVSIHCLVNLAICTAKFFIFLFDDDIDDVFVENDGFDEQNDGQICMGCKEVMDMPKSRISREKKSEIMRSYFDGLGRDENAERNNVSGGTASSVKKEFINEARSSSLNEASVKYDVEEEVQNLLDSAAEVRKTGTSVQEATIGFKLIERLSAMGIDLDKLKDCIGCYEKISRPGYPAGELIEASSWLCKQQDETGLGPDAIVNDLESKVAKSKEVETEIQTMNEEVKRLRTETVTAKADLEKNDLTLEKVEETSKIKTELATYGIDLTQVREVTNFIKAFDEADNDAHKIIEYIKRTDSVKGELDKKLREKRKVDRSLKGLKLKIGRAKRLVNRYDKLISSGWTPRVLAYVQKLTKELGSPQEVLGKFKLYSFKKELKPLCDKLKADVRKVSSEKVNVQKNLEALSQKYKAYENIINDLMHLSGKGFSKEFIMKIHDEAVKYGSPEPFLEAFRRYQNLEAIEAENKRLGEERTKLIASVTKIQAQNKSLQNQRDSMILSLGEFKIEFRHMSEKVNGLKVAASLAIDPTTLSIDAAEWIANKLKIWAKNMQTKLPYSSIMSIIDKKLENYAECLHKEILKLKEEKQNERRRNEKA